MNPCFTVDAKIIRDKNGRSKGFGFVDLESTKRGEDEAAALTTQVVNGSSFVWFMSSSFLVISCALLGSKLNSNLYNLPQRLFHFMDYEIIFKPAYRRLRDSSRDVTIVKVISVSDIVDADTSSSDHG